MAKLKEYIVTIATSNRTWTKTINTYSAKAAINGVRSRLDPETREHAKVFIDTQSDLEKFKDIEPGKELLDEMNKVLETGRTHEEQEWYGIRRAPVTTEQLKEICGICGHTFSCHHNPDDQCIICGCEHFTAMEDVGPHSKLKDNKRTEPTYEYCAKCGFLRRITSGNAPYCTMCGHDEFIHFFSGQTTNANRPENTNTF